MSTLFKVNKPQAEQKSEEPVVIDGQRLPSGAVRYKITCDGGVDPSGVYWSKTVPAGAKPEDYAAAQAERDAKQKELKELVGAA